MRVVPGRVARFVLTAESNRRMLNGTSIAVRWPSEAPYVAFGVLPKRNAPSERDVELLRTDHHLAGHCDWLWTG
jgi:hypothetical protein